MFWNSLFMWASIVVVICFCLTGVYYSFMLVEGIAAKNEKKKEEQLKVQTYSVDLYLAIRNDCNNMFSDYYQYAAAYQHVTNALSTGVTVGLNPKELTIYNKNFVAWRANEQARAAMLEQWAPGFRE